MAVAGGFDVDNFALAQNVSIGRAGAQRSFIAHFPQQYSGSIIADEMVLIFAPLRQRDPKFRRAVLRLTIINVRSAASICADNAHSP